MAAPRVTTLAAMIGAAALQSAAGYQWAQAGGGIARSNLFPPSAFGAISGIAPAAEEERTAPQDTGRVGQAAAANPVLKPRAVPGSIYAVTNTEYQLQKSAPPVVTSTGTVIIASPVCDIVGLPSPDNGASWAQPMFVYEGDVTAANSDCYDMLLDEADNFFHTIHQREFIDNDTVAGYSVPGGMRLLPLPNSAYPIDTLTSLPLFDVYTLSSLYTPGTSPSTPGAPTGKLWIPSTPLLSQMGAVLVDTAAGSASGVKMGTDYQEHSAGSVAYPAAGLGGYVTVLTITPSSQAAGGVTNIARAYRSDGTVAWSSAATGSVSGVQPHPLYIPGVSANRIYIVPNPDLTAPGGQVTTLYCLLSSGGGNCAGFPATLPTAFDSWPTGWWYGGALVPSAANQGLVSRLLYTVDLQSNSDPTVPIGCVVAISAANGAVLEHYCVARDPAGREASSNFLATAPVVAVNARGTGAHTAWVAQYDGIMLGFDPLNLAAGPLYVIDPTPAGDSFTIACDYLTITAGGSILTVGWRIGSADSEFVAVAVPAGVYGGSGGGGGGPSNAPAGLAPGAAAAVALVVIGAVVGVIAFPYYRSGALGHAVSGLVSKYKPSQVRYIPVATTAFGSSGSSASASVYSSSYGVFGGGKGGSGVKAPFAASGSYGSTASSASASGGSTFTNL